MEPVRKLRLFKNEWALQSVISIGWKQGSREAWLPEPFWVLLLESIFRVHVFIFIELWLCWSLDHGSMLSDVADLIWMISLNWVLQWVIREYESSQSTKAIEPEVEDALGMIVWMDIWEFDVCAWLIECRNATSRDLFSLSKPYAKRSAEKSTENPSLSELFSVLFVLLLDLLERNSERTRSLFAPVGFDPRVSPKIFLKPWHELTYQSRYWSSSFLVGSGATASSKISSSIRFFRYSSGRWVAYPSTRQNRS